MNIGFIGLGDMGFPMAENLLKDDTDKSPKIHKILKINDLYYFGT